MDRNTAIRILQVKEQIESLQRELKSLTNEPSNNEADAKATEVQTAIDAVVIKAEEVAPVEEVPA